MRGDPTSPLRPIDPLLAANGDLPAVDVAEIYHEHRRRLVGLATAITFDRAVAEEVVQEAFVGLQRHAGRGGHSIMNPLAYLQRSVVNLSVNVLRRRKVAELHPSPPPLAASSPEVDDTWACVVRLPPRQRAVVVLRYWHDMTVDAVAETLDWPSGSVKSTLHRALKTLQEELR